MQIRCGHCGTDYEVTLPEAARTSGRPLKFRCSACGKSFVVSSSDGAKSAPAGGAPRPGGYRIEQGQQTREVADLAELQRLVAKGTVGDSALISSPDGQSGLAGAMPELAIFFELVERATGSIQPVVDFGGTAGPAASDAGPSSAVDDLSWLDDIGPERSADPPSDQGAVVSPASLAPEPVEAARVAPEEETTLIDDGGPTPAPVPAPAQADAPSEPDSGSTSIEAAVDETDLWGPAFLLGEEDAVTEHAPMSSVLLGDEENTSEVPLDDFYDFAPRTSGGAKKVGVLVVALVAVGGGLWWSAQDGRSPSAASPDPVPPQAATSPDVPDSPPRDIAAPGEQTPASEPAGSTAAPPTAPISEEPSPTGASDKPSTTDASATPVPEAKPKSPPPPKKKAAPSASALVDQGWRYVDRGRLKDAKASFARAVKADASSGEAHFGAGYVAEQVGDTASALASYCAAKRFAGGDVTLQREVNGRLRAIDKDCS